MTKAFAPMQGEDTLLCVGLTTLDVVARPVALEPFDGARLIQELAIAPAGTAAGAAMIAANLGVKTRLAGLVGDDAAGRFVRSELEHHGVDTSLLTEAEGATAATLLPIDQGGTRPVYHVPGVARRLAISDAVQAAAQACRALHYAGVGARNLDGGPGQALLAAAKAAGALTTLDLIGPGPSAVEEVRRLLPHVDVFLPSAVEARVLTGQDDLERAALIFLDWGAGRCVIKNGGEGALAAEPGVRPWVVPAAPLAKIVDT